ncbi:hypothetical protein Bbelb_237030 [Branchiostoma belcheri]|nr:hypothetical protein Bbelb_237030 [Branchiostoma belcheri]
MFARVARWKLNRWAPFWLGCHVEQTWLGFGQGSGSMVPRPAPRAEPYKSDGAGREPEHLSTVTSAPGNMTTTPSPSGTTATVSSLVTVAVVTAVAAMLS